MTLLLFNPTFQFASKLRARGGRCCVASMLEEQHCHCHFCQKRRCCFKWRPAHANWFDEEHRNSMKFNDFTSMGLVWFGKSPAGVEQRAVVVGTIALPSTPSTTKHP